MDKGEGSSRCCKSGRKTVAREAEVAEYCK